MRHALHGEGLRDPAASRLRPGDLDRVEEVEVEGRAKPKKIKFYDQPKIFTDTCYYVDVPVDWWYRKFANLMDAVRPNGQFNPKKVTL